MDGAAINLIELRDLTISRNGQKVLDGINLRIKAQQHTLIRGPNGAGKSTLLLAMAGLLQADDTAGGTISWLSAAGYKSSALAGRACSVLVSGALQEFYQRRAVAMTGREVVLSALGSGPFMYHSPSREEINAAEEAARIMGAQDLLGHDIRFLSQGQLRLLLLCKAQLRKPPLVLLDEFSEGFDEKTQQKTAEALALLGRNCTLVFTSHRNNALPVEIRQTAYIVAGRLHRRPPLLNNARPLKAARPVSMPVADDKPRTLIEAHNATVFANRRPLLHNINWKIRQGEHWALGGANGSGKTTLLRLLAAYEYPASGGRIIYNLPGEKPHQPPSGKIRKKIHLVSESLLTAYTYNVKAEELVLSGFESTVGLYREYAAEELELARHWMRRLQAEHLEGRNIHSLSSGELRKLFLARAMVAKPVMLLLDEPFAGLDATGRSSLMALITEHMREGRQIIITAHHAEDLPPEITLKARLDSGRLFIG